MERATVRWSFIDNLMISFVTPGNAVDAEFDAWMKEFTTKPFTRYLSTSVGFINLHSVQRKRIADAMKQKAAKTSVVTDEMLIRGVVTAISWMGADIKAFSWAQLREAIRHLDVSPTTEVRAMDAVVRMKSGAPATGAGAVR